MKNKINLIFLQVNLNFISIKKILKFNQIEKDNLIGKYLILEASMQKLVNFECGNQQTDEYL